MTRQIPAWLDSSGNMRSTVAQCWFAGGWTLTYLHMHKQAERNPYELRTRDAGLYVPTLEHFLDDAGDIRLRYLHLAVDRYLLGHLSQLRPQRRDQGALGVVRLYHSAAWNPRIPH